MGPASYVGGVMVMMTTCEAAMILAELELYIG